MGIWDILYGLGDIHPLLKLGDGTAVVQFEFQSLFRHIDCPVKYKLNFGTSIWFNDFQRGVVGSPVYLGSIRIRSWFQNLMEVANEVVSESDGIALFLKGRLLLLWDVLKMQLEKVFFAKLLIAQKLNKYMAMGRWRYIASWSLFAQKN